MDWIRESDLQVLLSDDDKTRTLTSSEQKDVELRVLKKFRDYEENSDIEPLIALDRINHAEFLKRSLERLSKAYQSLHASQPWLCYWIVHGLTVLNQPIDDHLKSRVCKHLSRCQQKTGGFGGGVQQFAHLATTYAAVNCLCDLGTEEAYKVIDRKALISFLRRMKNEDGSFSMHEGGEADTRSVYCAASVAKLTGIFPAVQDIFMKSPEWLVSCQTYEGGIGGCPGAEAHGGYTFCGFAALVILESFELLNLDSLLRWACNRQMRLEGGFQGRTNKLVDSCYSFWQGGVFPLLHCAITKIDKGSEDILQNQKGWLYDEVALQHYILLCCQCSLGGIIDKPGKSPDLYHTCYGLSGLASSQHSPDGSIINIGHEDNQLVTVHPVFNVSYSASKAMLEYFSTTPLIVED